MNSRMTTFIKWSIRKNGRYRLLYTYIYFSILSSLWLKQQNLYLTILAQLLPSFMYYVLAEFIGICTCQISGDNRFTWDQEGHISILQTVVKNSHSCCSQRLKQKLCLITKMLVMTTMRSYSFLMPNSWTKSRQKF